MARYLYIPENKLRKLYEGKKLTTYEIAEQLNCCPATIWKKLHLYGIKPRSQYKEIPEKELENLYLGKRLSDRKIAKIYSMAHSTIYRKIREYGFKTRNISEAHIIYPRKNFSGDILEKAYLVGFKTGDLRARICGKDRCETISVDCGSTIQAQIDLFVKLFKPYGKVWVSKPLQNGKQQMQVGLNKSFSFLLDKEIDWVFKNKKTFLAFLAGFTDAEGSIFFRNNVAAYSLGNYDENLLQKIQQKLLCLRVDCRPPYSDKRQGTKNSQGYTYRQNYWHFAVNRKKELYKLLTLIEPYIEHPQKIKALKEAKRNIELRNKMFGYGK